MKNIKLYFIVSIALIFTISCSRTDRYILNDWNELNLKNSPIKIIETSSFSPNDLINGPDSIFKYYINQPIKNWFSYSITTFDTSGFILAEENHLSTDNWDSLEWTESLRISKFGDKIRIKKNSNDTVQFTSYYKNFPSNKNITTYILDKNGIPSKKLYQNSNITETDSFIRDNRNRVVKVVSEIGGIDDCDKRISEYDLNEFGDPITEIVKGEIRMLTGDTIIEYNDTVKYEYIYDKFNNWIFKIRINDGSIIVQRTIFY